MSPFSLEDEIENDQPPGPLGTNAGTTPVLRGHASALVRWVQQPFGLNRL